jgi:hypothetical protein
MQYLHDAAHGVEGGCFLMKVFCEAGCVAIVSECSFVLFDSCGESSSRKPEQEDQLGRIK